MEQYSVIIQNSNRGSYYAVTWIAVFLNIAAFGFLFFYGRVEPALISIGLVLSYFSFRLLSRKQSAQPLLDSRGIVFLLFFVCWLIFQNYLIAFLCLVFGITFRLAMEDIHFLFNKECVRKMNVPRKEIMWEDLENVILKDQVLTIDFKNNSIYQAQTNDVLAIPEPEFNAFVKKQLLMASRR